VFSTNSFIWLEFDITT